MASRPVRLLTKAYLQGRLDFSDNKQWLSRKRENRILFEIECEEVEKIEYLQALHTTMISSALIIKAQKDLAIKKYAGQAANAMQRYVELVLPYAQEQDKLSSPTSEGPKIATDGLPAADADLATWAEFLKKANK